MTRSPLRDLVVGIFVLAGLAAIAVLAVSVGGTAYTGPGGFTIHATFDEVGGLTERSAVVIGGVRVGRVVQISLDPDSFRADVAMDLDPNLELPEDTSASILTQGVLGGQYIALEPGGSDEYLSEGEAVGLTQSAVVLERLIGRVLQSFGGGNAE